MKGRNQKDFMTTLRDLMHPKKRLHSLMMCHSLGSFFVGIIGFLFPATFGWYVFAVLFVKILNPYNIQCLERVRVHRLSYISSLSITHLSIECTCSFFNTALSCFQFTFLSKSFYVTFQTNKTTTTNSVPILLKSYFHLSIFFFFVLFRFFLDAKMDSFGTEAAVITRLYCALVFAQGWIIMNLTDSTRHVKKVVIQSYFGCFLASFVALMFAHLYNDGTMSGGFFGVFKLIVFFGLTAGYGWFALFQPPEVFDGLGI